MRLKPVLAGDKSFHERGSSVGATSAGASIVHDEPKKSVRGDEKKADAFLKSNQLASARVKEEELLPELLSPILVGKGPDFNRSFHARISRSDQKSASTFNSTHD